MTETATAGQALGFTIPAHGARGRLVQLGAVADEVLGAHAYPDPVARLLAEALALAALLGALLAAEDGQLTLQVRGGDAPIDLLVTDWRQGELRGYASLDLDRRFPLPDERDSLRALFGDGQLVLTVDRLPDPARGVEQRYQGIVDLDAPTLEAAAQRYFTAREQVETLVRLAAARDAAGRWQAGGLLLQRLPENGGDGTGEDGDIAFEEVAVLGASIADHELTDAGLAAEALLWRLFHQREVRVFPATALRRGCRCTVERLRDVLGRFSETERSHMRNADGQIAVDCEFCARQYLFDL